MPVKKVVSKPQILLMLSKQRVKRYIVTQQTWLEYNQNAVLIREKVVHSSNNKNHKPVYNCGVAASRTDAGNSTHRVTAGGNVTQINYYGQHYSRADGRNQNRMDPEQFTKPIVALGEAVNSGGPALKSPTVEEAGYSDRIAQITSGNSTITTQEAAAAVVGYGVWPEYDEGVGESMDASTKPGPASDRFYTLDSVQWTTNSVGWYWRFPATLADLGVFGQNCQYHFLYRGGCCLHVQVNASKFHQGLLLVVAIPEFQIGKLTGSQEWHAHAEMQTAERNAIGLHQLTLFPHQFVNLRTNNSATIIMPFINCNPAENPVTHNNFALVITPIVPLGYQTGATPYVPITVSMAPMASMFSGLRTSVTIPTNVGPSASVQGVPAFDVPGSGQFVTTLRNDGYPLYPGFEETPSHKIPGRVRNLLEVCQVDTICNASGDVGNPGVRFDVSQQTTTGGLIKEWDLSMNSTFFSTTYLGRCAKWFTHYRGSIAITFMYTGSAMSTGKLLVAYTPPGASTGPQTRQDAMLATHGIWDIGLQSSFTLVVPFISQSQYRYNGSTDHVFGYDGWISIFYQTNIVVPPGAPTTTSIVALVSATKNFVFRAPTDSAFYQGLGDEIGKVITHVTSNALQSVQTNATDTGNTLPNTLSLQTGDAAALTAPETGASAATDAGQMMETRMVPVTYSGYETDVNNFMSRYAMFHKFSMVFAEDTKAIKTIPLVFSDQNTAKAVKAKYRMFTYIRCGYDVVVVSTARNTTSANGMRYQIMFSPPGAPNPTSRDSDEWYVPTTPSVWAEAGGTPASFRIPFMGVASAYACRYDGFPQFDPRNTDYGKYVGNYLGDLHIRMVAVSDSRATAKSTVEFDFILYARPTLVEAYIPRPILSLRGVTNSLATRGRYQPVSERTGHVDRVPEALWEVEGSEVENCGRRRVRNRLRVSSCQITLDSAPWYLKEILERMPLVNFGDGELHAISVAPDTLLVPFHLISDSMTYRDNMDEEPMQVNFKIGRCSVAQDYAFLHLDAEYSTLMTPLCLVCQPYDGVSACNTPSYRFWCKTGTAIREESIHVSAPVPHTQTHLFRVPMDIPKGYCGSPLVCEKHCAVVGFATASNGYASWFQRLADIDGLDVMEQGPAVEQGLSDWVNGIIQDMGDAFGSGTCDAIRREVRGICDATGITTPRVEIAKEIINMLVKVICCCVLISKAEDKASTAAALGVMIGTDLLTHSPFDWLERKVNKALGYVIEPQGPVVDWIKDFNAACTAAKSLEWIGVKIQQFVEWITNLVKREEPRRKRFMQLLEDFPDMMESMDKVMASRGKFSEEHVRKLCDNIFALKKGADLYGHERAMVVNQIIKYYNKAMGVMNAMTKGRHEPVAVLIHGSPGTGKSLATEIVGRCLTEKMGGNRPYSLPPDPKHFDGYAQQPVVIMDDVGQNPDGEDLKLFCQMVSSTEFIVPMASLEEKGMAFTSPFVLASTNSLNLAPPTISEPKALQRRFFIDADIELNKEFAYKGKITADAALTQCNHPSANFPKCCPLICGQAMRLRDRRDGVAYSLDDVVTKCLREQKARSSCGNKIDALFQGPDDEWFQTDYDRESNVLKTIEEQMAAGIASEIPAPSEIADLLKAVPHPDVIAYCKTKGWIVPQSVTYSRARRDTRTWAKDIATGLSIVASVASVVGFVWMMYKVFATAQGAYTGMPNPQARRPELRRRAVVQGPDMEFVNKIMNQSLFDVQTRKGHYTGLGVFDTWMVLPKHSDPGNSVILEGKEVNVMDSVDLENTQGSLELTCVLLDRPVKFRDIRKFIPDHFSSERECYLAINNENFRRITCPIGTVTSFGFLNLSGNATYQTCTYRYPTRSGQCGGVVCKAGKIIGMHIGGDGANGYAAILKRSMFAMEQGEITTTGKAPRSVNVSSRTKLHPSVFYDLFPGDKEPAALHPKDRRLEVDLEEAMFSKYKGNVGAIIDDEVEVAICHYVDQIKPLMPENLTEPLPLEDVVYGTTNLDGLDLNTSAGYPYNTLGISKRDLIPDRGRPLTRLQQALDLHGYDLPFTTYLKDELRPLEKVKKGKTRLIECSSLNDTIRMKRIFGRLFQVFHQNPGTTTGSAVGCNPDVHWSQFFAEMGGNPLVAFDYSNFDASMDPMWFDATKEVLRRLGYTEEHLKCIDHIKSSDHIYKDKMYHVEGGMPSGCSGTSIFNSINNNLIIRTLVLKAYKGINLDDLRIIAYGDDVVATYPYQLDAQIIADEGKAYGLTMTPPDKSQDFNETNWENVTFLKRKFVPDEQFPFLIHPVFPMKEIHESIRWTRSAANTQDHVHSLCLLAWHAGEVEYNEFLNTIRKTPVGRALTLPSYRVLRHAWLDLF